jgi:TolB-like protein/tetratricopeptide (TPR) repeat protein/DNA-binding winged helix-turn-helix (wHTH) protein
LNADLLQGFYLGDLLIEPLKGQVIGRAGSRHLPPKAVEVLLCLARAPGELVSRDTLLEAAWGPGNGSQEALSHTISEIRRALDDHADDPVYIQTLPRLGYRLAMTPHFEADHAASIVIGAQGGVGVEDIGLFENLQRRGVFETALAYLIVGWLLIQVADIVFGQLHLPAWAGTFVTALVIAGFPIAIVLSWYLEFRDGRAVLDELPPADARRRRFSRTYLSVTGALAIAAIAVYAYDQSVGLPKARTPEATAVARELKLPPILDNSIAVLPFLNLDGSNETQIFADGLVDDVITQLSRVPGLRVASRGDSFTLAPNSASQKVRNRLRVNMYLEGSVEMAADRMRVIVQMIDSSDGFHILSRKFDRTREDFFDIRDEITSLTVANVRVALPEGTQSIITSNYEDTDIDAYILYRRGKELLELPPTTEILKEAKSFFEQALTLDPSYAAAHAGLCLTYAASYNFGDETHFIGLAESACAAALATNPNLYIVYSALGELYYQTGNYVDGQAAFEQALAINPQDVNATQGLAAVYERQLRFDEAEELFERAIGLQPGNWRSIDSLGAFLFAGGRYGEAADAYRMVVSLDPLNWQGLGNLGSALLMSGNFAEAAIALQRSIEIAPDRSNLSNLAINYYYLGEFDQAVSIHRKAVELFPESDVAWLNLADALVFSSESGLAAATYRKSAELSEKLLRVDPRDSMTLCRLAWATAMLRNGPRAEELINRARESAPNNPYVHYYEALLRTRNGAYDAALDSLEIALDSGFPRIMLVSEPLLADLRDTERFSTLVLDPLRENQVIQE